MAAAVERLERKKARVEEANALLSQLDEVTQKAVYIATTMFLAKKDTVTADNSKGGVGNGF